MANRHVFWRTPLPSVPDFQARDNRPFVWVAKCLMVLVFLLGWLGIACVFTGVSIYALMRLGRRPVEDIVAVVLTAVLLDGLTVYMGRSAYRNFLADRRLFRQHRILDGRILEVQVRSRRYGGTRMSISYVFVSPSGKRLEGYDTVPLLWRTPPARKDRVLVAYADDGLHRMV